MPRGALRITSSRKPRGREEDETQIKILTWLRKNYRNALIWHTPNGGKRNKSEAIRLKQLGVLPGVPDLFALLRPNNAGEPFLLALEIKASNGTESPAQKAFRYAFNEMSDTDLWTNGRCEVVRSVEEVKSILYQEGLLNDPPMHP